MNMLTSVLVKLGLAIFSALPIERILAMLLNKWLDKINDDNIDKATKTAQHLAELSQLFSDILTDKRLTEDEVKSARDFVAQMREELLKIWAKGDDSKVIQQGIAAAGVKRDYVEPLLNDSARSGYALHAILRAMACMCLVALICAGCLTRTRCQEINAKTVNVNVWANDPETMSENAYPRSLTILSQDQMVEGGTDSIASGNRTDPSLSVPMGDSALGALGALIGGGIKAYTTTPAKAGDAVADGVDGADCATGDCAPVETP